MTVREWFWTTVGALATMGLGWGVLAAVLALDAAAPLVSGR